MLEIDIKIKVTKIFNDCFLLLDQLRFCEIHFTKISALGGSLHGRHIAISPILVRPRGIREIPYFVFYSRGNVIFSKKMMIFFYFSR